MLNASEAPLSAGASSIVAPDKELTEEEKAAADRGAVEAENELEQLKRDRDKAWAGSRSRLATASDPPVPSERVLGLLSAEHAIFDNLEKKLAAAREKMTRKRRLATLTATAWAAQQQRKVCRSQRTGEALSAIVFHRAARERWAGPPTAPLTRRTDRPLCGR